LGLPNYGKKIVTGKRHWRIFAFFFPPGGTPKRIKVKGFFARFATRQGCYPGGVKTTPKMLVAYWGDVEYGPPPRQKRLPTLWHDGGGKNFWPKIVGNHFWCGSQGKERKKDLGPLNWGKFSGEKFLGSKSVIDPVRIHGRGTRENPWGRHGTPA